MTCVLVVDDSPTDRRQIVAMLQVKGHTALEADSGEQALSLTRAHRPDVILADILMPSLDGYELIRQLRSDEATARLPLIFFSEAYLAEEVRRLAAAFGVSHVLIKPSDPEEVLRTVDEAHSSTPEPLCPLPTDEFHRKHLRLANAKLLQMTEELRETVILAGTLQRESDQASGYGPAVPNLAELETVLSRRELEVLSMIVDGATNADIAERLVIACSTVQSHVKHILHKLGVKNRTEAAVRYVRR